MFRPSAGRRVVVATNVAESSLTVPGVRYVVDDGTARISRYAARTGVQRLPIEAVSKASARQRAGRCGRVGPGVCVRLYSEENFESREDFTPPEIQRSNLAGVILDTGDAAARHDRRLPAARPASPRGGAGRVRDADGDRRPRPGVPPHRPRPGAGEDAGGPPHRQNGRRRGRRGGPHRRAGDRQRAGHAGPRDRPAEKRGAADAAHEQFLHSDSDFLTLLNIGSGSRSGRNRSPAESCKRPAGRTF